MSFNIALSGVSASQRDLDTTANNIANVNTVGFKESRAEFGDVYAASLLASGKTKVGDGVITQEVAQQFTQGALEFTENSLDLAITGTGFFATVPEVSSDEYSYTRAGMFKLDSSNYMVNSSGEYLLGYPVNADGTSSSVSISTAEPVLIPDSSGSPSATSEVSMEMNLPAGDIGVDLDLFDPTDSSTYNASTSVTIYDSLGDSHIQTYYFLKDASTTNEWVVATYVDDEPVDIEGDVIGTIPTTGANVVGETSGITPVAGYRLVFDSSGDFTEIQNSDGTAEPSGNIISEALGSTILDNGADVAQTIGTAYSLDTSGIGDDEPTQFSSDFEVTSLDQDGLATGILTGVDIDEDGLVRATFSNGTSEPVIRIGLVRFANEQGLTQISGTSWKESTTSGEAVAGEATVGTYGTINSSALEQSNVNLTTELIDLIIAQRNFQANSRSLEVNNSLTQTVLNIR